MSLRKVIKTRSSFPTDEAVTKLFYLALRNISKKWAMPIRDWKAALNRFSIQFAYSTGFCHPVHRYSATGSTIILPGQSERSEARFSG